MYAVITKCTTHQSYSRHHFKKLGKVVSTHLKHFNPCGRLTETSFYEATVDDVLAAGDGDGGLCDVGGKDEFSHPLGSGGEGSKLG